MPRPRHDTGDKRLRATAYPAACRLPAQRWKWPDRIYEPVKELPCPIAALPSQKNKKAGHCADIALGIYGMTAYLFLLRLNLVLIAGQRAKIEVVRPPRGVNSPRTTHHSGRTAATISWRILFTAFS